MSNVELAVSLREIADFLDEHPELPGFRAVVWMSDIRIGNKERSKARAELTAVAGALGDRAEESVTGSAVRIAGQFGPVSVHADARLVDLGIIPEPPEPEYEPIIPVPAEQAA